MGNCPVIQDGRRRYPNSLYSPNEVKTVPDETTTREFRSWVTKTDFVSQQLPLGQYAVPVVPTVHLWYFNLAVLWQPLAAAMGVESESSSHVGLEMTMPQLRFARRFYLRMLLGAYLGVPGKDVALARGFRGKPVLDTDRHGHSLHFSLAKSGDRLLIGISGDAEIGVDLEVKGRKPRNALKLARRFFTKKESLAVRDLGVEQQDAEFMRIWACKEAVAKASGHGIANRFCRFSVQADEYSIPRVTEDPDHPPQSWQLALVMPEEGYLAAVAAQQEALRLQSFRIEGR